MDRKLLINYVKRSVKEKTGRSNITKYQAALIENAAAFDLRMTTNGILPKKKTTDVERTEGIDAMSGEQYEGIIMCSDRIPNIVKHRMVQSNISGGWNIFTDSIAPNVVAKLIKDEYEVGEIHASMTILNLLLKYTNIQDNELVFYDFNELPKRYISSYEEDSVADVKVVKQILKNAMNNPSINSFLKKAKVEGGKGPIHDLDGYTTLYDALAEGIDINMSLSK